MHRLVGREGLLTLLTADVADHRLVTLVGTGGVGKTSVAYELARRIAGHYADGVQVVELSTVVDEDAAIEAVATALDVSTRQLASIEDAIVDTLSSRRQLLVLDNCEHVIEPVAVLVGRVLRSAPDVAVLATSREALAVTGEHVRSVEPLDTGELEQVLDDLDDSPTVALFVERAGARSRVHPHAANAPSVVPSGGGSTGSRWPSSSPPGGRAPSPCGARPPCRRAVPAARRRRRGRLPSPHVATMRSTGRMSCSSLKPSASD